MGKVLAYLEHRDGAFRGAAREVLAAAARASQGSGDVHGLALGASGQRIIGMILRASLGLAGLGVVIGLGLALWAGRFVKPLLFETSPRDPLVIGGVVGGLLVIAVLASVVPAFRAKRVSPMEALRAD